MNILQILPELNVGGVETGTLDLARHLVSLGHKAVVVSNGGDLVKELESCGAIHYQLPVQRKSIFSIIRMVRPLVQIIEKEKIDIVHARSRVPAWVAYFACRKTRAVFITTCHGYYKKHPFSLVMGWAKRVIVLSNVIGRHMIDDFGVSHERIRLIPRSVDLEKFKYISLDSKTSQNFNVGIIGRITPLKGHLYFIKAMAKVAKRIPQLKIWIVGDAPNSHQAYKEELRVLVKRLGLSPICEFLGTSRDIPAILANLDCLVLATITHEAFGRVIIEAQASGVPVVSTRMGGAIDIIEDKKTGLLIPPADPEMMSQAVIELFEDKQLRKTLAQNAYTKVKEKFDLQLMVRKTLEVYDEALRDHNILIIKLGSLGDVILSTAAIKAIREKYSDKYRITFLVGAEAKEVLLKCPYIDELLVCDFKNKDKGIKGLWGLADMLRNKNFDMVIDLQNNRKSHLLSFLTFSLNRYGYDNKKLGFLLNHSIKDDKAAIGPVIHQFRILKMLGIESPGPASGAEGQDSGFRGLELWTQEKDARYIEEFLASQWLSTQQKIIGINISASLRWASKNWPLEHIIQLSQELSRRQMRIVLTGTEKDLNTANILVESMKNIKLINACGKTTVSQLACLIKKCAVYISSDSASLHIAAAVGVPFIALFGPTDPRRHLPPAKDFVMLNKELPCGPCYKPKCKSGQCMSLITVEEVLEAVEKLLNK